MSSITYEEIVKRLENLTPGGSEYHNDPAFCLEYIERRMKFLKDELIRAKLQLRKVRT